MNILFISSYYPPKNKGGAEISTHIVARGLVARGHKVTVVTDAAEREEGIVQGVRVIRVPLGLQGKPLFERRSAQKSATRIRSLMESLGSFDVVHAQDFRSALALSELHYPGAFVTMRDYAAISGCTNNMTADGSEKGCAEDEWHCHRVAEASFPRNIFRLWQYLFNKQYRRQAFGSFARQVYISHAQKEIIGKYLPLQSTRAKVIYNPIAPEYLQAAPVLKTSRTILYVGRVEMYKGVDLLLKAWREVSGQMNGWKLVIVGDGADRTRYERDVATWGLQYKVEFKKHVPIEKLMTQYDDADVVVAPHRWVEPFGRTVVEAMARSRIVITADRGGPAEVIEPPKTGLLFAAGDYRDLARVLLEVSKFNHYDRKEMQTAARAWVINHLTMNAIAEQYEQFYQQG